MRLENVYLGREHVETKNGPEFLKMKHLDYLE